MNIHLYSINQLYLIKEKNILITYSYKGTKYKKTLDNSAKKKNKGCKKHIKKIMSLISNKIKIKR